MGVWPRLGCRLGKDTSQPLVPIFFVLFIYTVAASTVLPSLSLNNPTVRKIEMPSSRLRQGILKQEGRHPTQRLDQHPSHELNGSAV